jgi:thiamine-phosphate pyrophosphorylase
VRGLYAIVDIPSLAARGLHALAVARAVLTARPCALQVRAKDVPTREVLAILRSVAPLCRAQGVPLVANDRVDLAALAGCDFVHLGQEDLPIELARRIAPHVRVGLSTHNEEQLTRALEARPTYVAYGPVYPTASKARPDPCVGLAGLRQAAAQAAAARVPLVAIGGITLAEARDIAQVAPAAAVISALVPPPDATGAQTEAQVLAEIAARARQLQDALGGGGPREAHA